MTSHSTIIETKNTPLPARGKVSRTRRLVLLGLIGFVITLILAGLARAPLERYFQIEQARNAQATLTLAVEGLEGSLNRFRPLPALIAKRPELRFLLSNKGNELLTGRVSEQLRQTAFEIGASDIYLMDISGLTLAASNYRKERSFIGRSFEYRPYFTQALEGGTGRYFALGTTSGERGYFYAAPVEEGTRIVGVLALKFTVDAFERAWAEGASDILVSDLGGIIFMASRPDWHFKSLRPLTPEDHTSIKAARQYPPEQVALLPNRSRALADDITLMTFEGKEGSEQFVTSSTLITDAGWWVTILTPIESATQSALTVLAIALMLVLLSGLISAIYLQRRNQLRERLEAQRATQSWLEQRVSARTADLNAANARLQDEVEERRATEDRLRKTQTELIQAGKLAALGQMSAALSHEFNQPLAAVKAYAENAKTFLERDRSNDAQENITRISAMADRMATISKHLRNFARRPQEEVRPVPLLPILDEALALMEMRLRASRVDLRFDRPDQSPWVIGGAVRLQQVIMNLISNALDAMESTAHPRLDLHLSHGDDQVSLTVRDHGPGFDGSLSDEAIAQVFDPFFTTKDPGKGLGLGLSISYNIIRDFGGRLEAKRHAEGGALFTLTLQRATPPADALSEPGLAKMDLTRQDAAE